MARHAILGIPVYMNTEAPLPPVLHDDGGMGPGPVIAFVVAGAGPALEPSAVCS